MNWTPEAVDKLRSLAGENLSGSQIATRLKTTRNAVLGKCHRLGIKLSGERTKRKGRRSGIPTMNEAVAEANELILRGAA